MVRVPTQFFGNLEPILCSIWNEPVTLRIQSAEIPGRAACRTDAID
jgi:hypothetical protein